VFLIIYPSPPKARTYLHWLDVKWGVYTIVMVF
jgi:hypothetical protein